MKWYFKVIAMVALAASIVSCKKDDMKYADAEVSAVENLYAPADGNRIKRYVYLLSVCRGISLFVFLYLTVIELL